MLRILFQNVGSEADVVLGTWSRLSRIRDAQRSELNELMTQFRELPEINTDPKLPRRWVR